MTWKLKSCSKCQGDIYVDCDEDGLFSHCLQCGRVGMINASYLNGASICAGKGYKRIGTLCSRTA